MALHLTCVCGWRLDKATCQLSVPCTPPQAIWAPSQYPKRRLFVRSRKVSKPRDWYFKLSYRFEIWQAHRQHCCRSACQISERSDNSKYKSRGFETTRSYEKTSFRILRRGPGSIADTWTFDSKIIVKTLHGQIKPIMNEDDLNTLGS